MYICMQLHQFKVYDSLLFFVIRNKIELVLSDPDDGHLSCEIFIVFSFLFSRLSKFLILKRIFFQIFVAFLINWKGKSQKSTVTEGKVTEEILTKRDNFLVRFFDPSLKLSKIVCQSFFQMKNVHSNRINFQFDSKPYGLRSIESIVINILYM